MNFLDIFAINLFDMKDYKVHLAVPNKDGLNPFNEFTEGRFISWNEYKPVNDAFNRTYILSFAQDINNKIPDVFIFVGIYEVLKRNAIKQANKQGYKVKLLDRASEHIGKLKIQYINKKRNCRRNLDDKLLADIKLLEIT